MILVARILIDITIFGEIIYDFQYIHIKNTFLQNEYGNEKKISNDHAQVDIIFQQLVNGEK